jgi:hypothetical protein
MRIWAAWKRRYLFAPWRYEEAFARLEEGVELYSPDLHPGFMPMTA